jgi:restriction system protein
VTAPAPWSQYQQDVAKFFQSLGIPASTDVLLEGVRGRHAVDVVARPTLAGQQLLWIVECKLWKSRIPKEKVLALQGLVQDVGADRGYLMAENGYQRGALSMARLSNINLESLSDLRETAQIDLDTLALRNELQRAVRLQHRYWAIGKAQRIASGLRPDVGLPGYSARAVLEEVIEGIGAALSAGYPVRFLDLPRPPAQFGIESLGTPAELLKRVVDALDDVARRLGAAEEGDE